MSDTNNPAPIAEPASEPPHRLDSWATECSEPATDKDHLPVAPASAADGLPEPVAFFGRMDEAEPATKLYSADQLRTALAAERELRTAAEERQALYLALTRDAQDIAAEAQALLSTLRQKHDDALTLLVTLRQQLEEAVRDAKRYRWLRRIDSFAEWNRVGHYAADALDAAIDAAIAAQGEAKPPGVERELFEVE